MDAASYRLAKQAFVSHNNGSSVHTINTVAASGIASYILHSSIAHRLPASPVVDYLLTVVPLLVAITLASAQPALFVGSLLATAFLLGKRPPELQGQRRDESSRRKKIREEDDSSGEEGEEEARPSKGASCASANSAEPEPRAPAQPYLTIYRAHMMVITVLSILAVDFPVFPREFGKTELWGTSLMDVGVGSFVFSLGLISTRPFLAPPDSTTSKRQLWPSLLKSIKSSIPTILLGLIRVAMVKGVEYPEHVTEYGVHWNFFFTMGLLPPFGFLLYGLTSVVPYGTMGILLTVAHQVALSFGGLQSWTLQASRDNLISANKEGLVSFPGYLSIYLLGLELGQYLLPPSPSFAGRKRRPSATTPCRPELCVPVLVGFGATFWFGMTACRNVFGVDVSRRLANLPYVFWIAAFNTSFLLGYLLVQLAFSGRPAEHTTAKGGEGVPSGLPLLLHAANKNALVVFLSANLLTGLVNVSLNTLETSSPRAVGVLVVYSAVVYGLAWTARGRKLL